MLIDNSELRNKISSGALDGAFAKLYSEDQLDRQKARYIRVSEAFDSLYGEGRQVGVYSAPGRTEVGGNHTDHNHGKVLAAGINLDAVAIAGENKDNTVRIKSEGYGMDVVSLDELEIKESETGHSASLVRGVCAAFVQRGYKIGGFDAATASDVLSGSGLSSSAAFEVLVGTIINNLFNGGSISPVEIAKIAQWAENVYFGKPCGLMDQTACSVGGFVKIDFNDPENPIIEKVDFDFDACGHSLCIVDSGADHSDLTDDYAAVRGEMESAAAVFGKKVLRDVDKGVFFSCIADVRHKAGDRAVLRALHFYGENERVEKLADALKNNDFDAFKAIIIESGHSSFMYNQNVFTCKNPQSQAVSLALAVSDEILDGKGAYRVHGGGFAGTIQAFVPNDMLAFYQNIIGSVFGEKACYVLKIRPFGGCSVLELR
ncbi:MAG: galactokinase [Clostridiales bacterium]|nr:galactokinase [Clostridiales bacterium]